MVTSDLTGFRLSPQQEHLWRAQGSRLARGFVCQGLLEVRGPLDRSRLRRAVERMVERHEILRTSFRRLPGMSLPIQVIRDRGEVLWSEPEASGPGEAEVERFLGESRRSPVLQEDGTVLQVSLISLGEERHGLLLTLPVLAADALSLHVLAQEIALLYDGEYGAESLPDPVQYADAAETLQEWLGPEDGPGAAFWRQQGSPFLQPADAAEHPVPETAQRRLPAGPVAGLAGQLEVPVPLLLLAAWSAALWWETGEERRIIAVAHDGRTSDELSRAAGPYARYLPLQSVAGPGITLGELARSLEGAAATATAWQDAFSLDRLVNGSAGEGAAPLWPFGFDSDRTAVLSPAISLRPGFVGFGRFGLRLSVLEDGPVLRLDLHYDPSRHGRGQAERLLDRLERVLAGAAADREAPLGEIDVLGEAERRELLAGFNDTAAPYPADATVCDLFEERVRLAPQAPAVIAAEGVSSTFEELDARANRLARHLRALGIGPESRVGIHLEREPEMVVALLAVLKAGGAYVPFDAGHPAERLRFLLEDADLAALVTRERLRPAGADRIRTVLVDPDGADAEAVSRQAGTPPPRLAGPDNAAYVIYTSGSTGVPKGVVVTHRGLVNYLCWARTAYETGPGRGAPVHSPLGFDLTVTSLFVPLLTGAAITLLPEDEGIGALTEALRAPHGAEEGTFGLAKITPAHLGLLRQLTADGEPPPSAACLVIGGDALWAADIAPWRRRGTRIFNEYGPTETVVGCCVHEVGPESPDAGAVPIGRPIANTRLYVMGPGLRPVPAGAPGELWIGGEGVARGYLGRPALTAERFVPDPFAPPERAGGRLYRTGDLVRLGSPGSRLELEFLGRIDDQIKIRGHRVEPGEVAAALASHPGLRDAAVALRGSGGDRAGGDRAGGERAGGEGRLVAWIVARDRGRRPTASELRRFLAERLPEPMIPAAYVHLDILPLTPNGKLDRRALPDPDRHRDEETPYAPPRTSSEEVLAEIWGQVLGVDRVGIDDHFFSLGGDSIRSLQVLALAQKRGLAVTLQDLFQRPTIRSLVERVHLPGQDVDAAGTTAPFSLITPQDRSLLPAGIEDAYPLGRLQAGMLFHSELAPESAIYHDLHSFQVRAAFSMDRMREAVQQISLLHPVLRTSFDLARFSESLQLVHAGISVPLEVHDLCGVPAQEQEAALSEWLSQERLRAFDWAQPPLVKFHVHVRDEGSFQLTMSFHHAILDGWSAASLLTDLFRRYALLLRGEEPPPDAALAVAYRDFVALERAAAASEEARSFWRRILDGAEPTRLPRLVGRGAAGPEAGGPKAGARQIQRRLDPTLSDDAKRVAREAEVPIKSLLLAVHLKVASVLSGARDVLTGLVSHGRPEHVDGERALGLFLNTLPLRVHLRGGTWRELAQDVFELERQMFPFRHFPLAEMRDVESSQLRLEIAYNYLHYHVYKGAADVGGIEVLGYHGYEETNFPLITHGSLDPFSQDLQLGVAYRTSDLDAGEAERFAAYLLRALGAVVEDPSSRYDAAVLLSAAELAQVLEGSAGRSEPLPVAPVHHLFERQASRAPGSTALVWERRCMSYGALETAANRLAQHLRSLGVGPEVRVAVLLERSTELVVALLAILKAGGAYVPLDPAYPAERIALILADSAALLLVTEDKLSRSLPARTIRLVRIDADRDQIRARPDARPAGEIEPGNLAYVIYTSGSTGSPKGVQVTHANAARLFAATDGLFGFGPGDVWTFFHSVAFDFSVWEIWGALLYGGRLVVVPHRVTRSPEDFHALLAAESVTVLNQTPSAFQQLAAWEQEATAARELSLRLVIFGGEALNLASLQPWFERYGDVRPRLVNMYGITETTVHVTFRPVSAADLELGSSPIGGPVADLRLSLLAADGTLVPVGVPGEIHVGGAGLARGYLGRPALTAERFVPDPFGGGAGERLYRSGDLARRQPDGSLEYLGRIDHQVKIRGFRIELGEIESALAGLAGVREAVVVAREDRPAHGPGDRRLVAYVAGEVAADTLRQSLRERLPDYMVPAAFVILPELPLTANGKVDRKALPAPEQQRTGTVYLAPRTPVEEVLAGIWAEILGLEQVGATDHFFELGGHSLLATRVMSRLRSAFDIEMPLRDLFEAPVLSDLATRIETARRSGAIPPAPPLVPVPREGPLPLSFAQQRLWFVDQLEPGSPAYNIPGAVRLSGPLDLAAFAAALSGVAARHESLRTTFPAGPGGAVQHIAPPSPPALPLVDLSALPATIRESAVLRVLREEVLRPFDLARGPLLRTRLLRLGREEHCLVLTLHHIVSDGWSMGVLVREVAAFYAAALEGWAPGLPDLPVQYADFAVWQREWLAGPVLDEQIEYWRERLAGAPLVLDLPADRPRPPIPSGRGGRRSALLSAPLSAALSALARREGCTLFMTLLAGFTALLHRYTAAEDLVVGTDVANRNRAETEGLIGFFVNQLALRARLEGDPPLRRLLAQVRETALGAYAHQDLPFERLVEELQPERDLARQPVFQISFVLQNVPFDSISLSGLSLSPLGGGGGTAKLDLALEITESSFGLQVRGDYALDLFDGVTIDRLLGNYETLLAALAADPDLRLSELPLLRPAELQQTLLEWNDSAAPVRDSLPVHRLFAEIAAAAPGAVAAACRDERRTYGELAGGARLLAARLAAEGIGPEAVVPLLADRGLDFLTAVLSVFRAGAAYVPLDPSHPGRRLARLVADCGARVVVAAHRHAARLAEALKGLPARLIVLEDLLRPGSTPTVDVDLDAGPSGLAYVIYTSGSTGTPKGAMVEQRGMLNHLWAKVAALGLGEGDVVAQTASQCFDISVWQLLAALLVGGRVEIFPDDVAHDPQRLLAEVESRGITVLETVPSLLRLLIEELEARGEAGPALDRLRWVIPTGEALPPDLCRRWLRLHPGIPLLNAYGPTECSDDVTHHLIREAPPSGATQTPIGRPVPNLRLYVLDAGGLPSPAGVPGELFVAGTGVGRGYFGASARTAEAFVPDPFSTAGERLYRTGDLARLRPDGTIEFLGRRDHQVKIRGHRIELEEIEAVLTGYPGVRTAAVVARGDMPGDKRLVAYVVPRPEDGDAAELVPRLRTHVAERLPDSMMPAAFLVLDELPLTPNGKLDRRALPEPDPGRPTLAEAYAAPRLPVEEILARIWAQVLRLDRVGVHDNFFELGGDSILSIQVVTRAGQAGLRLTPRQMFQYQTIAELAAVAGTAPAELADQGVVVGELPLTPIQHWFFAQGFLDPNRWNQAVLLALREPIAPALLAQAFAALLTHHDALRLRFPPGGELPRQVSAAPDGNAPFTGIDLSALPAAERSLAQAAAADQVHDGLDLARGPIARAALFDLGSDVPGRLLIVVHHLAVDGVSWRILLDDLELACRALARGEAPILPPKTLSFRDWAARLVEHGRLAALAAERDAWLGEPRRHVACLPVDTAGGANTIGSVRSITAALGAEETQALLQEVPRAYRTQINDALLTALARTLAGWTGERRVLVDMEAHGREDLFGGPEADLSRTVGWFTCEYPLLLTLEGSGDPGDDLRAVKEQLRAVPRRGLGYGLLRYLGDRETAELLAALPAAELIFNYLGQLDQALAVSGSLFGLAREPEGMGQAPRERRSHLLEVTAGVTGGRLMVTWMYSHRLHRPETIGRLAEGFLDHLRALIAHCRATAESRTARYTPSDFPLAQLGQGDLDRLLGTQWGIEDLYPLSPLQEGILFESLYAPGTGVYVGQVVCRLDGALDPAALAEACRRIVARHAVLRTSFHWRGLDRPLQALHSEVEIEIEQEDWTGCAPADQAAHLAAVVGEDRRRGFDLSRAPLCRWFLARTGEDEHRLLWTHHHIVLDGWSFARVAGEFLACYRALRDGAEPQLSWRRPYRDYIAWLETRAPGAAEEHWRRTLAGWTEPTLLGIARAATGAPAVHATCTALVPAGVTAALQMQARRLQVTLNTLIAGAWATYLGRTCGRDEVVFGTTVSGRSADVPGIEEMVGLFINTLPLRLGVEGRQPLAPWLRDLQLRQAELIQHEQTPLLKIQSWSELPRGTRLFDSVLVFENWPLDSAMRQGGSGLALAEVRALEQSDSPLTLVAVPGHEISLRLEHDTARIDAAAAARTLAQLAQLLEGLAGSLQEKRIDDLPLLAPAERHQLLAEWNDTARTWRPGPAPLHRLIEEQVDRTPGAVAVVFEDEELTYRRLDRRANRLAAHLQGLGVGLDALVAVCLERSTDLVVALLAILKAGGAYVPFDPDLPHERLAFLLADTGASVVLTARSLAGRVPPGARIVCVDGEVAAGEDDARPAVHLHPENLAYAIYTSGSTGRPKGAMNTHAAIVNRLLWMAEEYRIDAGERVLQKTPYSFDVSVWELFLPLLCGATLVVARPEGHKDPAYLAGLIVRHGVTTLHFVPSMLRAFLEHEGGKRCTSVRRVICSGEALPFDLQERLFARLDAELHNLYGPTEAAVDVSAHRCVPGDPRGLVPIGRPIANLRLHLLGRDLHPVPLGAPGELWIGGDGLARGYLERPDLTAERFLPDATGGSAGSRLYRTGDLARRLPDGSIEFLGRLDFQVKLRGFRIELGEIEAALLEHAGVKGAVVMARDHETQGRSLVAYVVPRGGEVAGEVLRESLRKRLPQYMVPAAFVVLPELPLTSSGKVDRRALSRIEPGAPTGRSEERGLAKPAGQVERAVAAIWREVLGVEKVGRNDSFFDLGGHSLLLIRVQGRLAEVLGREVSLVDLFRYPTVSALAGFLAPHAEEAVSAPRRRPLSPQTRGIAIIGVAGRFPGSPGIEAFWQNLCAGVESISFHSDADLQAAGVAPALRASPHFVPAGGVLEGIELFDADFFGYTPRDAEMTDPQHRLFLESAWEALESAGYVPEGCPGPVGVFAGGGRSNYLWNLISNPEIVQAAGSLKLTIATEKDFLTTTVSYKLGLQGPSFSIQTACSTSLVAVHVACRSLLAGECDMALAGGVSINVPQHVGYLYQEGGIRSPDGHCRAFDARAQGTVGGNGVGIVVLKRLEDALADGDPVRAVILGSAINNDGSGKVGYTAPGVDGQATVIRAALEGGGVDPRTIGYVEAHGTGTPLGDPIEVAALTQVFSEAGAGEHGFCALGSVKTNVGHLDAAAGVAGLIKAALAVERGLVPPSLHFESPNPAIDFAASPFRVNDRLQEWRTDGAARRAGVSSFGIGGTNAHVVLEEPPAAEPGSPPRHPWQLLVVSARTPSALDAAATNLRRFLEERPDTDLADAAWTLQTGRRAFGHRRAVLCKDAAGAAAALAAPGGERAEERRGVVFLFPGQGAQHPGMGLSLFRSEPVFRAEIDRAAGILRPWLGLDLRDLLAGDLPAGWDDTALVQPALFAVEHALARLWMSWGIRPEAMIGHSVGEYVAACLAGVFSFEDGLALLAQRGRLLGGLPRGGMVSLPLSEDEVSPLLEGGLDLAAVNGPGQCVLSGPEEAVRRLLEQLAAQGLEGRRLRTSHAFHSAMVEPVMAAFASAVGRVQRQPPRIPWISNLTGTWISAAQATDPGYWAHHLRATVRFADGLATLLRPAQDLPSPMLLEVGPGRTLSALARRHPDRTAAHAVVTSLPHPDDGREEAETVLAALGQLWSAGAPVDWRAFHAGERRRRIALPTYPFERRRYWIEPGKGAFSPAPATPEPGRRELADWFSAPFWKPAPPVPAGGDARGPWLVFLGDAEEVADAGLGEALLDHLHRLGAESIVVRPGARSREDYGALLSEIARERGSVPSRLLHLRSAGPPEPVDGLAEQLARLAQEKDRGFYDLLFLLQALGDRGGAESFEITVVTACAQRVAAGDLPCPERAMMHALCRVAPREHAGLSCRVIDIGFPLRERWLGRIAADVAAPASEPLIAWRGGERWLPDLMPLRLEEGASPRDEGVWLVTGGLGGVGLEIAGRLAASRARLVLLGRSGLPPEQEWDRWLARNDAAELSHREIHLRRELGVQGMASRRGAQESLDAFCSARILRYLIESGIEVRRGAHHRREELLTALRLLPKFHRFLDFFLGTLAEDGWIRQEGDEAVFQIDAAEAPDPAAVAHAAGASHPVLRPILERVDRCAAAYGPALSGDTEALEVLFSSDEDGELVQGLSHEPVYLALAAQIALRAAERCASEGRALRVLEVGGGRGGLTRRVAPALAGRGAGGRGAEYWFTDIGRLFVTEAEREAVGAGLDFLRFGLLDASRDPVEQGYEAGSFDLLFALNVIHATPDVEATLRHLRRLLRPGGSLCLIELTRPQRWIDMVWGLAEGWWFFSDSFRQGSPLLGVESWKEVLARAGFDLAAVLPDDGDGLADSDCGLLLATRPGAGLATSTADRIARIRHLRSLGAEVIVETADTADVEALRAVARRAVERFGHLDGVIHAAGVSGEGLLGRRTRASLEEELAAKVQGALAIGEVCRELSPDHLVLFSSIDALSGQPGQSGSCAAHAFLDAWAHLYAAETGTPTLAIDWDRWQGTGMAAEAGEEPVGGLSPAEGVEAFVRALASGRTQLIVSPEDIATRLTREPDAAATVREPSERRPAVASVHDRPSLATAYAPPSDDLEQEIAEIWQEVFGIQRIGIHDDFFELGGDSLVALQLVSRLGKAMDVELKVRSLFDTPTIAALAVSIEETMLASVSQEELDLVRHQRGLS